MKPRMHWITLIVPILLVMCAWPLAICPASPHRGIKRVVKDGKQVMLYKESHALVIGVSHYTRGWSDLPGVEKDIQDVKSVLEKHGFGITTVMDPDKDALDRAIGNFISLHGKGENNRLLIYFAGHGHTLTPQWGDEKRGYLVPRGAPNPYDDPAGFKSKVLSFQRIEEYAYDIDAKHAVFIFDACFSGSLLSMVRAVPEEINSKTASPIRQFFTSGDETEKVPDKSIFKAQFVAALEGEGDLNKDGYVTGTELGNFLQKKVIKYSKGSQHPQYGTIRHPKLDKGDFVFILPETRTSEPDSGNGGSTPAGPVLTAGCPDPEYELWQEVKPSKDPADFNFFLSEFPNGKYSATARYKLRKLKPLQESKPAVQAESPSPGDTWIEPVTGMVFVWVPKGCFNMGSDSPSLFGRSKVHYVCLDGFWMGKTEVTQGQWKQIMGNNPSRFKFEDSHPVEQVSWHNAKKFISKLNAKSGQEFNLPSEAQWEYAARSGGKDETYAGGDHPEQLAWYDDNSEDRTHTVATKSPNGLGLYDMSGNVSEWCEDVYDSDAYAKHTSRNPVVSSGDLSSRVIRGGNWGHPMSSAQTADRSLGSTDYEHPFYGFRVCAPRIR